MLERCPHNVAQLARRRQQMEMDHLADFCGGKDLAWRASVLRSHGYDVTHRHPVFTFSFSSFQIWVVARKFWCGTSQREFVGLTDAEPFGILHFYLQLRRLLVEVQLRLGSLYPLPR
jgi:hypothetical protein